MVVRVPAATVTRTWKSCTKRIKSLLRMVNHFHSALVAIIWLNPIFKCILGGNIIAWIMFSLIYHKESTYLQIIHCQQFEMERDIMHYYK